MVLKAGVSNVHSPSTGVSGFGYNYNKGAGSAENRIENPNMKWEKNNATITRMLIRKCFIINCF